MVFPIGFDLESGINEAERQANEVQERLQRAFSRNIVSITPELKEDETVNAISKINKELKKLSEEWNKMDFKDKFINGDQLSDSAEELVIKYKQLSLSLETYGKTLAQIAKQDKKDTDDRIKGLKKVADEQRKFEQREMEQARRNYAEKQRMYEQLFRNYDIKGVSVGFDGGASKGLGNSIKELNEIEARLREIDALYARINSTGAATKDDGSASARVLGLLKERNELEARRSELTRTASEAAKRLTKDEEAAQKRLLALEKQRAKEEEAANLKRQQMLNARYAARAKEKQALTDSISDLRKQRAALSAQEDTIAKINAKLAVYNKMLQTASIGSDKFKRITDNINRLSEKLGDVTGDRKKEDAVRRVTKEYKTQTTYVERLIKRMAVYASFSAIGSFMRNVREVTAQFELQRKSLGAIIQDQTRANALFSEIQQFAMKSPVSIMDLTKYTKQVAAYGIETEKLFDTTKRLADISVGLGVGLDRLALFYGQVYATGYLRASEVRQATEAGIPLVAKLAEKLSAMNGELVTAKDVMDMISKRAISFDMVAEVFEDMTNKGGMFYNMQEKQGDTLYGMWAKLGDAASIMYDEIGNTSAVRKGMEDTIKLITVLMKNWKSLARTTLVGAAAVGVYQLFIKKLTVSTNAVTSATNRHAAALRLQNMVSAKSSVYARINAYMLKQAAAANIKAATATNMFTRSLRKLHAAMLSNWATAILVVLGLIIELIINAVGKSRQLEKSLRSIDLENITEQTKSVRNFESLAKLAVESADGSKKQRDALEELRRTYGEIIPVERLSIENLRKMKGNYDSLTNSVREYIQEQMKQKAVDDIFQNYGQKILNNERKVSKYLEKMGLSYDQAQSFLEAYKNQATDTSKTLKEKIVAAFKDIGIEVDKETDKFKFMLESLSEYHDAGNSQYFAIKRLTDAYINQEQALKGLETRQGFAATKLGKYNNMAKELTDTVNKATYTLRDGKGNVTAVDTDTYFGKQLQSNLLIKKMGEQLREALGDAWDDGMGNFVEHVSTDKANLISTLDFTAILEAAKKKNDDALVHLVEDYQSRYEDIIPSDKIINDLRDKLYDLSKGVKGGMDKMRKYTLGNGQGLEDHLKDTQGYLDELKAKIYMYDQYIKKFGEKGKQSLLDSGIDLDALKNEADAVEKYAAAVQYYLKQEEKKGTDPRLQTLKEIAEKMAQINKEYSEQLKYQDEQAAFSTTQGLFAKSFDEMNKVAKKYKFQLPTFETPKTAKDVEKWYRAIMSEITRLNIKDSAKVLIDLGFNADKVNIDEIQRDVERQLERMSDEIAKSKAVKEFFDKIFADTKDYDLAMDITVGIYGNAGGDYKKKIADQIKYATSQQDGEVFVGLDIDGVIDPKTLEINYKALRGIIKKFEDAGGALPEKQKAVLDKILKNGEEYNKAQIDEWTKVLNKNRDFAQRYIDIWREADDSIRDIRNNPNYDQTTKATFIRGYQQQRSTGLAALEWDMFKDMPLYVQMFDNLDKASSKALKGMRDKLVALQSTWGTDDDPARLKELQSRLNDIDAQLATKNPFRLLADSIREFKEAKDSLKVDSATLRVDTAKTKVAEAERDYGQDSYQADTARDELAVEERRLAIVKQVTADKGMQLGYERQISALIAESEAQQAAARAALDEAQAEYSRIQQEGEDVDQTNPEAVAEQNAKLAAQAEIVRLAQKEYMTAVNTTKSFQKQANVSKKLKDNINKVVQNASKWSSAAQSLAGALGDIKDLLGVAKDSSEAILFDSAIEGLENFSKLMGVIIALQTIYNAICESNPWLAIAAAILAVASMIGSLIKNERIAQANKTIKNQEKEIKRLEREYERLQNATDKVFGGESIDNYQKRLQNLEKQAEAYRNKAEAEKSKGKDAEEDTVEDYLKQAEDAEDKIDEMTHEVSERMMGTSLESAAVSFAQSWLDAYLSFSDTTEAMKEKYRDMIKSFIVQNVLARYAQALLKPLYEQIDEAANNDNVIDDKEIEDIITSFSDIYKVMDSGMTTLFERLKEKIPELGELFDSGDMTGISRDIATASEESINGLAVGINTQNFYISRIYAALDLLMESMGTGALRFTLSDATMQALDKHLSYLPTIAQHTANAVARCERAAVACEGTMELLGRVIKPEGSGASYRVYVA